MKMRPSHICASIALVISACGSAPTARVSSSAAPVEAAATTTGPPTSAPATTAPAPTPAAGLLAPVAVAPPVAPPPVLVRSGDKQVALWPSSYCWAGCGDRWDQELPPDIGSPEAVEVGFEATDWRFQATAVRTGERCGRAQTVTLDATGPTTYRLGTIGAAGDYVISLFGRAAPGAAHGGDISASFRWHTPHDGPNVAPAATASIVAGRPPDLRSFGVGMAIQNLRSTPRPGQITANVVVRSAAGASMPIELDRKTVECEPEGSVSFTAPAALGQQASKLGPAPFRYDVEVVIDSVPYRGTGIWPDDVDPECSPCTRLHFDPPLPGL